MRSDRRLADHFGGKLHLGYMAIRQKQAELKVTTPAPHPSLPCLMPLASRSTRSSLCRRGRVRQSGKQGEAMRGERLGRQLHGSAVCAAVLTPNRLGQDQGSIISMATTLARH